MVQFATSATIGLLTTLLGGPGLGAPASASRAGGLDRGPRGEAMSTAVGDAPPRGDDVDSVGDPGPTEGGSPAGEPQGSAPGENAGDGGDSDPRPDPPNSPETRPSSSSSSSGVGLSGASSATEPASRSQPPTTGDPAQPGEGSASAEAPSGGARARAAEFLSHIHPSGFVQVDYLRRQRSVDQLSDGSGQPLNENEFVLRNARFGATAQWRYFGTTASMEFFSSGGPVRPATVDVHAQLPGKQGRPPLVQLRAGLLRVPFGFENYEQTDVQRFFGERTLVSHALVPGLFDVGASLSGSVWALRWIVGVYNGQPVGAPGFGYRDPNRAKDYAGRVALRGPLSRWLDASLGFSFLRGKGFSAGTPPTKDSFDWIDLNEDGRVTVAELVPLPGTAGRPSEDFERWGLGADVQLRSDIPHLGELMVYGEFAVANNLDRGVAIADPVLLGRDQRGLGWYAAVSQALTRHAGVGLRYDEYYPHWDQLEPREGTVVVTRRRFRTLSAAGAGYLRRGPKVRARLLVEYEHQLDNDLGRDAQGRPAKLDNDTLRLRAEVAF